MTLPPSATPARIRLQSGGRGRIILLLLQRKRMRLLDQLDDDDVRRLPRRHLYVGRLDCHTSGRQGFAIRIVPGGPDFATPFEPGLITWN